MPHGLDTDKAVFFYEQEFYVFSNFSAFQILWAGISFPTSEHAYQWMKFNKISYTDVKEKIRYATSAHEAFKIAQENDSFAVPHWKEIRVGVMETILRTKLSQHPYVQKKLRETGDREIIENSWRDSFWGWGPNKDGENMLGKLWMKIRADSK
ncbi:MAG TPA: NADAR family protein [Alphaproteobacteria bacterium]|nr:NADAR family protein [Alphaproteobacteria bacterium]